VVIRLIALTTIPFALVALFLPIPALVAFIAFALFALFYSMPPVRAKVRPGLDSVFSAGHYIATAVFGYYLAGGSGEIWLPVVAGMLWAMAMHAYSAVPDIAADAAAGLATVATALGKVPTILACGFSYLGAATIAALFLGPFMFILLVPYVLLMVLSLPADEQRLFKLYTYFPMLNTITGTALFFLVFLAKGWL
jgi:4-hydroxybenzoate polyprenyltransferase